MTSPLGLVTTFNTFDDTRKRLPKTVTYLQPTVTVPGGTDVPSRTWTTETTYDAFGYVNTVTTMENGLTVSWQDFDYDALGRLTSMTLRESASGVLLRQESYEYDSLYRQTVRVDGRAATHTTDYDTAGRVKETIAAKDADHPAAVSYTHLTLPTIYSV